MNTKPSALFEGENSSLRKTFDAATSPATEEEKYCQCKKIMIVNIGFDECPECELPYSPADTQEHKHDFQTLHPTGKTMCIECGELPLPHREKGGEWDWREEFDMLFYKNTDKKWMSRGGIAYDSTSPEMGRGELFRFIAKVEQSAITRTAQSKYAEIAEALSQRENEILREAEKLKKEGDKRLPSHSRTQEKRRHYNQALSDLQTIIKKRMI